MSHSAPWMLQAKALGEHLVVGLIPDSEIRRCKGPPVMSDAERHTMVESVKWVDEVITGEQMYCGTICSVR
jgi:cytidyltransferase-like protein